MYRTLFIWAAALFVAACTNVGQQSVACNGVAQETDRLFLQQITDSSAIIKWRGSADSACIGVDPANLDTLALAAYDGSHKTATLTGLNPDTEYFYSVGGAGSTDASYRFRTAPTSGEAPADGNTLIWLLGDSGTQTEQFMGEFSHLGEAESVKQGFLKYNREQAGGEPLDLLLLLGDNAYLEGTDEQWQGAFFDVYPQIVRQVATWPTIGNHEMGVGTFDICEFRRLPQCDDGPVTMSIGGGSTSSDPSTYDSDGEGPDEGGFPYFDIFDLPDRGQMGGVASGTEQYYSIDYGNVHIVSLDSQLSNRDDAQRQAMRDWLIDDLSSNELAWTIVIFHHPPYSKGENHDSDIEQAEIDMRETFAPVFEDHGVDVVYSGHAHSYERSWYLHGHYGKANTFEPTVHAELNAGGSPALGRGDEAYNQISPGSGVDDKAVYTVAGSAGKADSLNPCEDGQRMGCTLPNWLQHPAHIPFDQAIEGAQPNGLARRGSVVIDVGSNTLTSRFVDEHGEVLDRFEIRR